MPVAINNLLVRRGKKVMCEYTDELYSKWATNSLSKVEQAFLKEHIKTCPDCRAFFAEKKEGLNILRKESLKFGLGVGFFSGLLSSIGVTIALKNLSLFSSRDITISLILFLPILLFMGIQIVVFKLTEGEEEVPLRALNLVRAIAVLFVFSGLLYSALFNIPILAKRFYVTRASFESIVLFINIVLSGPYWAIGNRLAARAYQKELETPAFVASLVGTWLLVTLGISYLLFNP